MTNFQIPSDVKVIVLTLRQSTDRQKRIKSLLDEAKIPFEFFGEWMGEKTLIHYIAFTMSRYG